RADQVRARLRVADLRDLGGDLLAHELPALAGLRPLGHLDLDFVGLDEVLGVHAEPAGRHLADAALEPALARVAAQAQLDEVVGPLGQDALPEWPPGALGGVVAVAGLAALAAVGQ